MKVKVEGRQVDVFDRDCPARACFWLGFDKGVFAQGRGYTRYHTDAKGNRVEHAVCWRRHRDGCPTDEIERNIAQKGGEV